MSYGISWIEKARAIHAVAVPSDDDIFVWKHHGSWQFVNVRYGVSKIMEGGYKVIVGGYRRL